MSEYADKYSNPHRKDRVDHILMVDPKAKIDASGYTPPDALNTEKKTNMYDPKPRAYAKGGKVEGEKAHRHAGRKSRDSGGSTEVQQLRPNVPTSGLYGSGFQPTHAGMMSQAAGLRKGGDVKRHKRAKGGSVSKEDKFANEVTGVRITGDRTARAEGGRAKGKGKTNINIIIGSPKPDMPMVPPPPSAIPPVPPMAKPGLPPAAMGAMMGPGQAPGAPAMPAQMPSGMGPR